MKSNLSLSPRERSADVLSRGTSECSETFRTFGRVGCNRSRCGWDSRAPVFGKHIQVAALFILAFAMSVRAADGDLQTDWSLKPSLLRGSGPDSFSPALKYQGSARYDLGLAPRDDLALSVEARGAVAWDARANSENSFAAFYFGYTHNFYDWISTGPVPAPGERRGRTLPAIEQKSFSALVDLFFKTRFETDQPFNNYNVTYGPHLGFTPKHQQGFLYLLPSCYVDYQRVEILHSRRYNELGINEDGFWRFDASAGWYYPIGAELARNVTWLRPLDAQFDLHYYRAYDLPAGAAQAGLDDAFFYAGTLGYNLRSLNPDQPSWFARYVPYVYVSVGTGRLPPATRSQTMVMVGLVYGKAH